MNPTRALAVAAGVVIIALTATAFWLSYAHLAEVALAHGMEGKEIRAWAWPACLDLFIMAGEILWLRASLSHRVDWWAIALTVIGSGGSIALNVAGVGSHADPLDYVVAAVPPTAALLAFGALMRQIHQALAGQVSGFQTPAEVTGNRGDITTVEAPTVAQTVTVAEPAPVVIPPVPALEAGTFWSETKASDLSTKLTTAVPAAPPRQVVTVPVAVTPTDLRREARRLNREAVRSTSRPVTIKTLQDELGLSRREATDLRREVVTP
ncbi:DUF2637 domain-containing protein [Streptomyces sp. NPDC086077]|uniref:DUF2637 domain-containing protein n=1 Tax=Streptomyces sp. NPDC086077 TaxID=3154862 RepID=UPI00341FE448